MVWIAKNRLVTAHILYRRPDRLWLLQEYIWQEYDQPPRFPLLRKFLTFWTKKIEGPIFSVKVNDAEIVGDDIMRFADYEGKLQ